MPADVDNSSAMNDSTASGEASISSSGNQMPPKKPEKRKRSLPGMPDPDAEVIAMSPASLMATNRFICEICNKGFKRDQNLQLHRRGHNLPWKLKHRSSKEICKRVYVCPEESCVHHDPLRALGDLTGIKKHFFRKHGEKKWKCDNCSKKYAVQSDWKAHLRICGTRDYKCDCGSLFSRRDSFITHRAFCDALAAETGKQPVVATPSLGEDPLPQNVGSLPPSPPSVPTSTAEILAVLPNRSPELQEASVPNRGEVSNNAPSLVVSSSGSCSSSSSNGSTSSSVFASLFASSTFSGSMQSQTTGFSDLIRAMAQSEPAPPSSAERISLCLATNHESPVYNITRQDHKQYVQPPRPAMSATALLQRAAQMGAAAPNTSLLRGFGIVSSTSPTGQEEWNGQKVESDSALLAAGLGHGVPYEGVSGLKELMMGTPSVFGPKHTTLDFLGLGRAAGDGQTTGLTALMMSSLDASASATSFSGEENEKSS
ncbi:Protein indeterminate-domain like [Heracleum sosnowskyi]|uniref:Protein indeterminate-domain like n=1 Tax=Heracleum sosnowskyi TaxID=360622 RepID=A0AAD8HC75_9APIA|nr:Protein indeterminate-domain like [Heracleum sosnowskyi]